MAMVSTGCPLCRILLVEASDATISNLATAANTAGKLGATVITNSYGDSERSTWLKYDPYYNQPGSPTFASAGDWGYEHYYDHPEIEAPGYPAVLPTVIAVGGTTLTPNSGVERLWSETVWFLSGGGCSALHTKPLWQKNTGCAGRLANDVAAVADSNTPVSIYNSYSSGGWAVVGGTSAGTPLWAGIMAQASAYTRSLGGAALYSQTSLHDITSGTNQLFGCKQFSFCNAQVGYDGPSGMGAPNGIPNVAPSANGSWGVAPVANESNGTSNDGDNELAAVSCTASNWCMAAGPKARITGSGISEKTVTDSAIRQWNGAIWSSISAPTSSGSDFPTSLSCVSSTWCLMAGYKTGSSSRGISSRWDGSTWTNLNDPFNLINSLEGTARANGISCTSIAFCAAVGEVKPPSKPTVSVLTSSKFGYSWNSQAILNPPGNRPGSLRSVSCAGESCMAVGSYASTSGPTLAFAARRSGSSWSLVTIPNPSGATASELRSVDCVAVTNCVAVGYFTDSSGTHALIERWNGSAWAIESSTLAYPGAAKLNGVSCSSSTLCSAAGEFVLGSTIGAVGARLQSGTWGADSIIPAPASTATTLKAVDCPGAIECIATGAYTNKVSGKRLYLAEHRFAP